MIPLVEDYLSELIQSKTLFLKSNPDHIKNVISTSAARLDRLAAYLQANNIRVIKGYPRTPAELPCVCILLSGEDESQISLGDYEDFDDPEQVAAEEHVEVLYECNYRLEAWSSNGDMTVDLYHIVKWALLSGRGFLDSKGLFRQKLGGADFEPATSYFPEFVYRRALTFWCQTIASVPVGDIPYITGVEVSQTIEIDTEE